MSKYIKLDDMANIIVQNIINNRKTSTADLIDIPTIEVSEDCISREDAEKCLMSHFIPQTYTGDDVEQASKLARKIMSSAPSVIPTQTNAIQHVESVESVEKAKEGEWIPCSERKPTKEGHYLCSFKKPQRIDNIYVGLAYWTGGRWYGYLANEINAWMPLPKPWKGVDDD